MKLAFKTIQIFFIFYFFIGMSQETEAIKSAISYGNKTMYIEARKELLKEIKQNPNNANAYYWLGRYSHYMVYDDRPFTQKSDEWSEKEVLDNLKKAIKINPNLGDAKYFLKVEYGARALEALRENNIIKAKNELKEAEKYNVFPKYGLEYVEQILDSCQKNSILFVNGDTPFWDIMYLQLIKRIRKDVSVIAVSLLERPFYIKLLRDGISNEISKVPINWNDNLIMGMYSYIPWKGKNINVRNESNTNNLNIKESDLFVNDNNGSLWIGTAAIIDILETNKFKRSIYTAFSYDEGMFEFKDYLKNEGFVSKLNPTKVDFTNDIDTEKFEKQLLNEINYKNFNDVIYNNQPRPNFFYIENRRYLILRYIEKLIKTKNIDKARTVYNKMNTLMPISLIEISEDLKELNDHIKLKLSK